MSDRPSSSVLFLTNCSLTKKAGGGANYDDAGAITSALPAALADRLRARRADVWKAIKNKRALRWQGVRLADLEFNRDLVRGFDFGGLRNAAYLPAPDRYQGRFFQALGAERKQLLAESGHRLLLLSGLYGLLAPTEPTQLYSCPLNPQVVTLWKNDPVLTDVLCEYIRVNSIRRIIDLTAVDDYRHLIDWTQVADTTADVLHCFDRIAAGEQALTAFGMCLKNRLLGMTEDRIIALPSEHQLDTVVFRSLGAAPYGFPSEARPFADSRPSPSEQAHDESPLGAGPWRFDSTKEFRKDMRKHMNHFTKIAKRRWTCATTRSHPGGTR